ncbi:purine-nucleoside phosphorylase [Paremcibacter congregatus]|uniref:purine-nucleoside phosphorylase n=1 Tax=Paremcibacter congregatus TaxID=2043170 RepID=UPI0030EB3334
MCTKTSDSMMTDYSLAQYEETCAAIAGLTPLRPKVGLILGSGLGDIAALMSDAVAIPYDQLPHFPTSSAPGHVGCLHIGMLLGQPAVIMQGRVHMYEGYTPQQVTFPVRIMKMLGVEDLVITNAAGGINRDYAVGDLMVIDDHIDLAGMTGLDPTRGRHLPALGPRFTPLNQAYHRPHIIKIQQSAAAHDVRLHKGVYSFLVGPSFESPAEIRLLRQLGVDAVGMSTVPEVIVARNAGIRVVAVSAITNMAIDDPDAASITTEEEVWENVKQIIPRLRLLVQDFIRTLEE